MRPPWQHCGFWHIVTIEMNTPHRRPPVCASVRLCLILALTVAAAQAAPPLPGRDQSALDRARRT